MQSHIFNKDIFMDWEGLGYCSVSTLSKLMGKSASHISHTLTGLEDLRLLKRTKKGKNVYVHPVFDVVLAYKKSCD